MEPTRELEVLIRAKYPLIYILSWEERQVQNSLRLIAADRQKRLFGWTITEGIMALDTLHPTAVDPSAQHPYQALEYVEGCREAALFVFKDFHPFLDRERDQGAETARLIRRLRDLAYSLKHSEKTLLFLSPVLRLPSELEKQVCVFEYPLPSLAELDQALANVIRSANIRSAGISGKPNLHLEAEERERVLKAAQGLTLSEAENVFSKSLVLARQFDLDVIVAEKKQLIRKSGVLEYTEPYDRMENVGGLDNLKAWMQKRRLAFSERARQFGLPEPRGVLLLGVPGGGKSLVAKATASMWQLPLLRLDMGKIFSQMVGASEQNIRSALRTAEAVAPTVLWLDELEKGLAGTASSHLSDAGTAARVFSSFLVWLQEKTAPVFVIATSNDVTLLPPELLRKGRFDEIFFVDLPALSERIEIFGIHLHKRGRDPAQFDLEQLARDSEGFSGAEIEQVIISALYDAFEDGQRELTDEDVRRNIKQTLPLSQVRSEQIKTLRDWARTHARPASTSPGSQVMWMVNSEPDSPLSAGWERAT
jgi:SpoVK/Ycf46/Vps4 family AAA+-type ATPase